MSIPPTPHWGLRVCPHLLQLLHELRPWRKILAWKKHLTRCETDNQLKCWPRSSKGSGCMNPHVGQKPNSPITFAASSAITLEKVFTVFLRSALSILQVNITSQLGMGWVCSWGIGSIWNIPDICHSPHFYNWVAFSGVKVAWYVWVAFAAFYIWAFSRADIEGVWSQPYEGVDDTHKGCWLLASD